MRYRVRTIAPMLVLLGLAGGARLRVHAQEPTRPEARPEQSEGSSEDHSADDVRKLSEGIAVDSGHRYSDNSALKEMLNAGYIEPNDVRWEQNPAWDPRHPAAAPKYVAYRFDHRSGVRSDRLTRSDVQKLYASGRPIVQTGSATQDRAWSEFTKAYADRTVIHEEHSANRSWSEVSDAVNLGNRRLDPKSTVIFNALPQQKGTRFAGEQTRMKIGGSAKAWEDLNENIRSSSGEFVSRVATKQDLLQELGAGTSSVVILYAHFDGKHLYLPDSAGGRGEQISLEEFAQLKNRTGDTAVQNRVIVLAVCSTAAKPGAGTVPDSLVSLLLQKGIGRTVFATQYPYDARQIPDLMRRLSSGTGPRAGGGQLQQYVELFPPLTNRLMPESEMPSGE